MGRIFISYRRSDAAAMSGRIYDAMATRFGRKKVFRDTQDIPVGVRFPEFLQQTLLQCQVAFILIGPGWLHATEPDGARRLDDPSDLVRLEVETALTHGLLVCPLLLEGAAMPAADELPPSIQEVHWHNALPIRSPDAEFAEDMQRLSSDIKQAVEGKGGRLVEQFAILGRTTAIPIAVAAGVAADAAVKGGIGDLFAKGCSTVVAKAAAVVVGVAVVATVGAAVLHAPPFPSAGSGGSTARSSTPTARATATPGAIVTPSSLAGVHSFPIPTSNRWLNAIAKGPDGNLWFTEGDGNKIGRITLSGAITEFSVPTPSSYPVDITNGPDGNLWFTEFNGDKIGRITPSGSIREFSLPTPGSAPQGITVGPNGNLWFTEDYNNTIGQITPGGAITEFAIPTAYPGDITSGPDGNLWFTEGDGNKIGQITPGGAITEFAIPTPGSLPEYITSGPDGNLWFNERFGGKIGRITPSGSIREFSLPTPNTSPEYITAGADGNLWFSELDKNQIGRITPSGAITEFAGFPDYFYGLGAMVLGPDGNLWITADDNIDQVTP